MIRATSALFALAVVICGFIIFRPSRAMIKSQDRLARPFEDGADTARSQPIPRYPPPAQAAVAAALVDCSIGHRGSPAVALTLPAPYR
jgi:hypothetical protein